MNKKAAAAMKEFLEAIGIDLTAAGMEKTPERVAKMYAYLFQGCRMDPASVWKEVFSTDSQGMVMVKDIPFYAMCEHHLVPFFGEVHIAYLPHDGRVAGFSKFTDLVEVFSRRPQLQERMTKQIADAIKDGLLAEGVLVIVEATQLCMTMRGEMAQGTKTITIEKRGVFSEQTQLAHEAWSMLMKGKKECNEAAFTKI